MEVLKSKLKAIWHNFSCIAHFKSGLCLLISFN